MAEFLDVDPRDLRLPPSRAAGADPAKLARQIARHGHALDGMPPIWVIRGTDGELMICDGVTRATRAAKLQPGTHVTVEVVDHLRRPCGQFPSVKDRLS